ncbi:MAG: aldo/keto reductase [Phycisphaerales bacterium]|nr:aldo/keto reductase [Phycisphaerales bacterium]
MTLPLHKFLPDRFLGKTGFHATRLGIGDLADRNVPIEQCVATIQRALDAGLNIIDTAPSYEDGYSEQIVGQALQGMGGGRRDGMFVIDKIDHFDQPVAPQIDGSLQRLQLDSIDLFLFHGLSTMEAWQRITATGDGMDQLEKCIQAGKARFRGISSHSPDVLAAAIPSGLCDVVLFPVGPYVDPRYITETIPLARKHNVGILAMKIFGAGKLLSDTQGYHNPLAQRPRNKISSGGTDTNTPTLPHLTVEECLHYTLSHDIDVALLGLSFPNEQDTAFTAAKTFTQNLSEEKLATIRHRALEAIQNKGTCWWNK